MWQVDIVLNQVTQRHGIARLCALRVDGRGRHGRLTVWVNVVPSVNTYTNYLGIVYH